MQGIGNLFKKEAPRPSYSLGVRRWTRTQGGLEDRAKVLQSYYMYVVKGTVY